jgi:hypothetical protein
MTLPALQGWTRWWGSPRAPNAIAREVVGPLGIADLVAVNFDENALRARDLAGILPTDDYLTLRTILACRRVGRSTADLSDELGLSRSAVQRAVRVGYESGALCLYGRHRYRTHPSWRPLGRRLVAVELKRTDWRRAAQQAWAYKGWASSAWLMLGKRPPASALSALAGSGIGLAYLDPSGRPRVVIRAVGRRRLAGVASVWAAEQALLQTLREGWDPTEPLRSSCATQQDVVPAHVG